MTTCVARPFSVQRSFPQQCLGTKIFKKSAQVPGELAGIKSVPAVGPRQQRQKKHLSGCIATRRFLMNLNKCPKPSSTSTFKSIPLSWVIQAEHSTKGAGKVIRWNSLSHTANAFHYRSTLFNFLSTIIIREGDSYIRGIAIDLKASPGNKCVLQNKTKKQQHWFQGQVHVKTMIYR